MAYRSIIDVPISGYDSYTRSDSRYVSQSTTEFFELRISEKRQSSISIRVCSYDTLSQLKERIARTLRIRQSINNFFLEKLDQDRKQWVRIDELDSAATIKQLGLYPYDWISVEYYDQQVSGTQYSPNSTSLSNNDQLLTLKLCLKPMSRSETGYLSINSSSTLKDLRKEAYRYLDKSYKNKPIFVWNQDTWIKYDLDLDDRTLSSLSFKSYMHISIDYDENNYDSKLPRGLCGIANLGNTCYMNSVFQCLSNIPEFKEEILALSDEINAPIVSEFRKLLKKIWSGTNNYIDPSGLLSNINDNLPRYSNYRQQDAQEFMNHFLHLIHAELSTRDSSLITELFYGKTRSIVKCLECQRNEITNESISFLPLPISNNNQKTILYVKANGEQCLLSIQIKSHVRDIMDLIDCIIDQYDQTLARQRITAFRLINNIVKEQYDTWKSLIDIPENELAFFECPTKPADQDHIWCNFYDRSTNKSFRPPTILVGSTYDCRYEQLSDQIDQLLGHLCSMTGASVSACSLYWRDRFDNEFELQEPHDIYQRLRYIKTFIIKMDTEGADTYKVNCNTNRSADNSGLQTLLTDFFREEPLIGDYHCLQCPKLTKARQKPELCLPLPPVLIIQLKRFSYDNYSSDKIDTFISFPIDELDLKEYITKDNNNQSENNSSTKYELVAVSNHTGSLISGHYVTCAKNNQNQKWYKFDDGFVRELYNENDFVTKNAYILIYVQKSNSKRG